MEPVGDSPHGGEPGSGLGVVSDVTRIGQYSPETFEAEWLDGATARPSVPSSAVT